MDLLVQRSDVGEFRRRYHWMALFVISTFAVLVGRLTQLQIFEGEVHRQEARNNVVHERKLATTRGVIRDAYGRVLAANRPSYNVYVVPIAVDIDQVWPRAAQFMGLDAAEEAALRDKILALRAEIGEAKVKRAQSDPKRALALERLCNPDSDDSDVDPDNPAPAPTQPGACRQILLKSDVDRDAVGALETHSGELTGIVLVPKAVRYYPYGELGAHLIGYMREVDADMLRRLSDKEKYGAGDRIGATGIERRWESYLKGSRGWRKVVLQRGGHEIDEQRAARYLDEPRRLEPIPGRDISLTVDIELVKSMHDAIRPYKSGAVAAVDVRTGRILGLMSSPGFDPNVLSGGAGMKAAKEAFQRLFSDHLMLPLLDKTMSATYPPGSTYKPFTALAALANALDPGMEVDCHGGLRYGKRWFGCLGVHGHVNLHQALIQSCNTYFYTLGMNLNIDQLARVSMDFGFGVKTGVGANPEARGRAPTHAWLMRRYGGQFVQGFTINAAIGQGETEVTVLQLALAYAALANGGTLYQPQVVRSIETSDGTVVQEFPPRVRRVLELDHDHLTLVKSALAGVVNDKHGTAHRALLPGLDVAGKTGTAQVAVQRRGMTDAEYEWRHTAHAWFAGYSPVGSPEMAIVALIEHGGGGGTIAAPVAMKVIHDWQALKEKRLSATVPASDSGRAAP